MISLHRQPKAGPRRELGILGQSAEQIQVQRQPLGFFGVDGESDTPFGRGEA